MSLHRNNKPTGREQEIAEEIARIIMEDQREKQGEFASEEDLKKAGKAWLKYLISEGFLDT